MSSLRQLAKKVARRSGRSTQPQRRPRWVSSAPNPPNPDLIDSFRFFAIIGSWMEADVIASTIANAFVQGCERVYLVDNASPDGTLEAGIAAGGIEGRSFATDEYDEQLRLDIMNRVVDDVNATCADDHIWWLYIDADEFPNGPGGMTLREYLASLDRAFRVVGARFLNHYPSGAPEYVAGEHPIDRQPLCEELSENICAGKHRKHPLLRHDKGGNAIHSGIGFHRAHVASDEPLLEPDVPIIEHHFPYRLYETSRMRLEVLCGGGRAREGDIATGHMLPRFRSLDAVYAQRWSEVENFLDGRPAYGVTLHQWSELVDDPATVVPRWYGDATD
jgi:hypothetical protein